MQLEAFGPEIRRDLSRRPGGAALVDALIQGLEIQPDRNVLDVLPGHGAVSALLAANSGAKVTALAQDPSAESATEETASRLGLSARITVVPGPIAAIPLPSEHFDRIVSVADPFPVAAAPGSIAEFHRVLAPDGLLGMAGAASFSSHVPDYMVNALREHPGVRFRTPAYTALMYAQEGFHIVRAEYFPDGYDYWREWLKTAPAEIVHETFREAVIEDGGRWLSLGLIILRKPPKPPWAV
jgi:cyclopropane fatty-acyl-phospholipid synthase-like methyltransferase